MSLLLLQRPHLPNRTTLPGRRGATPAKTQFQQQSQPQSQSRTLPKDADLAHMKLRHNAAAYEVKIKQPTRGYTTTSRPTSQPKSNQTANQQLFNFQEAGNGNGNNSPTTQGRTERPKLTFKHFKAPNNDGRVQKRSKPLSLKEQQTRQLQQESVRQQLTARADLDVGFKHVLNGNAPTVLGQMASQAAPQTKQKDKKEDTSHSLTERFSSEIDESLGSGLNGTRNANAGRQKTSRTGQRLNYNSNHQFLAAQSDEAQAFAESSVGQAEQMKVPSFVPDHGVSLYHSSGCSCIASFLGFADTF